MPCEHEEIEMKRSCGPLLNNQLANEYCKRSNFCSMLVLLLLHPTCLQYTAI